MDPRGRRPKRKGAARRSICFHAMSFRRATPTSSRHRRLVPSSSSRRLSSLVNPDVLNDVTFHVTEEFSWHTPPRRHSFPTLPTGSVVPKMSSLRTRAVSERLYMSKEDRSELLKDEREMPQKLERDLLEESGAIQDEDLSSWGVIIPVFVLFSGYLLSSLSLQKLNSLRPGCGQLVTLLTVSCNDCRKVATGEKLCVFACYSMVFARFLCTAHVCFRTNGKCILEEGFTLWTISCH